MSDNRSGIAVLYSDAHAIDQGYAAGVAYRGTNPEIEHLIANLWSAGQVHRGSPYLGAWKKGFQAGYRGNPMPIIPLGS